MSYRGRARGPQASECTRWSSLAVAVAIWTFPNTGTSDAWSITLPDSVAPCVPCHSRAGNDQVGEWLASPYSEMEGGRGCTGCHLRTCAGTRDDRGTDDDKPTTDSRMLEHAARLTLTAVCSGGAVEAEVAVSNVGVGHLLPTGPAARTLLLEVSANDQDLSPLPPRAGWRLPPFATDLRRYRFESPDAGTTHVSARLVLLQIDEPPVEIASASAVCGTPEDEPHSTPRR